MVARCNLIRTRSVQLRFQIFLEQLQCNVKHFHVREKKIGSYLVAGNPFAASWTFSEGPCCDDAESIDAASMASAATSGASGFLLGDDAAEFMRQRGEQT